MKKYLALTKNGILERIYFRGSIFSVLLGNFIYIIVTYFLWKAIFASSETSVVNGMTFYDTLIYLVLASAISIIMGSRVSWWLGMNYKSGQISVDYLKPMPFLLFWFFFESGEYVVKFVTVFIPTFFVVFFLTDGSITFGVNIVFFLISLFFSILINYFIDFIVGVVCFYTESIWGVNMMKEVVIAILSGARIPLAFFPKSLKTFCQFLPFQYIYNTPLSILLKKDSSFNVYFNMLIVQLVWFVITSLLAVIVWKGAKRRTNVNGG